MSRLTCWIVSETISAYSDGELADSERLAIQKHLASCEACRRVAARMTDVAQLAKSLQKPPSDLDALSDLERRVMGSVLATSPQPPERMSFRDRLHDWVPDPVAASVAIVFGLLLGVLRVVV